MDKRAIPHVVLVGVGLWLMAAPAVLGYADTPRSTNDRIVGPTVLTIAFLSIFAISRAVRWTNLLPGAWLLVAPWVLGATTAVTVNDMICGAVILALAPLGGIDMDRYGGGWASLFRTDRLPARPSS